MKELVFVLADYKNEIRSYRTGESSINFSAVVAVF
jgi:hypothetical protein